jgi:hypothetical protein
LYSISAILANLTNAIPVKKPTEEMIKLAEYSKHHIPEEDEKVFLDLYFSVFKSKNN